MTSVLVARYKTARASWVRHKREKNSAYSRQFRPFSSDFARIFRMGASPNLNRRGQTYYRVTMTLHWRPAP